MKMWFYSKKFDLAVLDDFVKFGMWNENTYAFYLKTEHNKSKELCLFTNFAFCECNLSEKFELPPSGNWGLKDKQLWRNFGPIAISESCFNDTKVCPTGPKFIIIE